MVKAVY